MAQTMSRRDAELFLDESQALTRRRPAQDAPKKVKKEWIDDVQRLVNRTDVHETIRSAGVPESFIDDLHDVGKISPDIVMAATRQTLPPDQSAAQHSAEGIAEPQRSRAFDIAMCVFAAIATVVMIVLLVA